MDVSASRDDEVESLRQQIAGLTSKLKEMEITIQNLSSRKIRFFDRCKDDDDWMMYYCNFKVKPIFALFRSLKPSFEDNKCFAFSLEEQFFLTLVKLAHNPTEVDLAFRFSSLLFDQPVCGV